MVIIHPNEKYMTLCIEEAKRSIQGGDYGIGALVVVDDNILSLESTRLLSSFDPTAHAEVLAIRKAAEKLKSRYILDGYLYTTCEPCPMCAAAAIWAKMKGIVYGANLHDAIKASKRMGQGKSWRQIAVPSKEIIEKGVPLLELYSDFMREECLQLF